MAAFSITILATGPLPFVLGAYQASFGSFVSYIFLASGLLILGDYTTGVTRWNLDTSMILFLAATRVLTMAIPAAASFLVASLLF
ncbi:hypothetical protein [Novosphingobium sp. BW1]|uniref:hypothetical protein n=1 Tax=Novosphingobium sp. BW1 TaxID=2592621 RepID=UPI0011DEB501|nr:hypothetical protein [Novosphingobium sp. BW1]TYC86529.1 hypothetical protein FMM79_14370 [Novosphingobium sp. BW1]